MAAQSQDPLVQQNDCTALNELLRMAAGQREPEIYPRSAALESYPCGPHRAMHVQCVAQAARTACLAVLEACKAGLTAQSMAGSPLGLHCLKATAQSNAGAVAQSNACAGYGSSCEGCLLSCS